MISHARVWPALFLCAAVLGGLGIAAGDARAVILYSTATQNTSPPPSEDGLAAWNLEGAFGGFLATPIASQYFIAAQHVGYNSSITFQGTTYQVDTSFDGGLGYADDPGSDLRIYKIQGTFPTYATLYDAATDGSEMGKTLTDIGRGTTRGPAVVNPTTGGTIGWYWGTSTGSWSWGQNVVSGYWNYNSFSPNSVLSFAFDSNGIANECSLTGGDSSGGLFLYSDGQWKLAGINWAVDSPWNFTAPSDTGSFIADLFDGRGLYMEDNNNNWVYVPNSSEPAPGSSYASRISSEIGWIDGVAGLTYPVPEPGTLMLLAAGAFGLVAWAGRRRKAT